MPTLDCHRVICLEGIIHVWRLPELPHLHQVAAPVAMLLMLVLVLVWYCWH